MAVALLVAGAGARAADEAAAQSAADYASAHMASQATLKKVAAARGEIDAAIARNDIAKLAELQTQVKAQIAQARRSMDMAYLQGAWNSSAAKQRASELRGRFEGVEILNFILLALLTGYEYPTKQVPASVKDTNVRLFSQLEVVLAEVAELNTRLAQAPRGADKLGRAGQ